MEAERETTPPDTASCGGKVFPGTKHGVLLNQHHRSAQEEEIVGEVTSHTCGGT